MEELIFPTILLVGSFLLAMAAVLFTLGSLRIIKPLKTGLFPYVFYAIFFSNGVAILLSSRNFSALGEIIEGGVFSNPITEWTIRLTSLLALIASADQLSRAFSDRAKITSARSVLAIAAIMYWLTNILVPAAFSANTTTPQLAWTYVISVLLALIFMNKEAASKTILSIRNATVLFCIASLAVAAVKPSLVLQTDYSQGLLGGVPRLFGLAPHAILMGSLACLGLWVTIYFPFNRRIIQRIVIIILLTTLFLTQAKAVWATFIISLPILMLGRETMPSLQTMTSRKYRGIFALGLVISVIIACGVMLQIAAGNIGQKIQHFMITDQGAQLASLTGRDVIWEVAIEEWRKYPVFGYGLQVFGPEHRAKIGMWFASSGHNQILDNLARAGLVGTTGMLIYTFTLLWLSIKYRRQTRGLSIVLILSIIVRMISEISLNVGLLGPDSAQHFLLICIIARSIQEENVQGNRDKYHAATYSTA